MSDQKEYIVTLHNRDDLDAFYDDMETSGGDLYIPDRAVDVLHRRNISRNTHYMLTDVEAEQIRNDPRVRAVSLTPEALGITIQPMGVVQTSSNFDKSSIEDVNDVNWGLLRVYEGDTRTNWGSNGTTNQSGTVQLSTTGKNVDVVIVDGHVDPDHPEYAVNPDGTGGSRVIQYNWFQHDVGNASAPATYTYTPYDGGNNAHGSHCAGTACGNLQGWARDANIYNIYAYGDAGNGNGSISGFVFDYIRAFHNSKPVNPETGRPNPTITNNSWGSVLGGFNINDTTSFTWSVQYRGQTYTGPFTKAQLDGFGIFAVDLGGGNVTFYAPARGTNSVSTEVDVEDAIADGAIVVGAAGNYYTKTVLPGDVDYNNALIINGISFFYYHRGMVPAATDGAINVGSLGTEVAEYKSLFSNTGERVDIWAPGSEIQSSVNGNHYGGFVDPRDGTNTNYLAKISGTSMASPQVCGVLACVLEKYPWMTQQDALDYLLQYAKENQLGNTAGGYTDYRSLQDAPNRNLYYHRERQEQGVSYPTQTNWLRPASGPVYPRTKTKRR